jgi:hypothetical protein
MGSLSGVSYFIIVSRDYMLRELCYDQDLYLLQIALVVLPPDLVIVSILDRFGLQRPSANLAERS